jgi:hypothetical protein
LYQQAATYGDDGSPCGSDDIAKTANRAIIVGEVVAEVRVAEAQRGETAEDDVGDKEEKRRGGRGTIVGVLVEGEVRS